jgi:PIN domain nuclease of toxin-antitoxin system
VTAYLLDTSIALLGLAAPERISPTIRQSVGTGPIYLSVISYWEVALKSGKGKLDVGDPRVWWPEALDKLAATPLPLRPEHISEICQLDPIHSDPFDRVLIAQAIVEKMALVTTDGVITKYASRRLRVIA